MLLLMGFFATYMGVLYNDFMSIPLQLFGQGCYSYDKGKDKYAYTKSSSKASGCVYPIGFDPVWMNSESDIVFYNSYKMKTSVVMGIIHMSMGIILKGLNSLHFNRKLDFFHEFIPQLILLLCLFGFMDLLIIQKWLTDWEATGDISKTPSIINAMIMMFLKGGQSDPSKEYEVIANQTSVMRFMLFWAVITPPWMLFTKPLLMKKEWEKTHSERKQKVNSGGDYELARVENSRSGFDDEAESLNINRDEIQLVGFSNNSTQSSQGGDRGSEAKKSAS